MKILPIAISLMAFLLIAGCLEMPKNYSCCLKVNASDPQDKCVMYNSSDPDHPIDLSANTTSCNVTAGTCNITTKAGGINFVGAFPVIIAVPYPPETTLLQICTEAAPQKCIDPECSAMVCGDFEYTPKLGSSAEEMEKGLPNPPETSAAINLYHGQCKIMPMDYKLANVFENSPSYLNRFRLGIGSSFEEYSAYSTFFPTSDKFCNANPLGTIDRYENYLTAAETVYDPVKEINDSCVSDKNPSETPLSFKLGSLNIGGDGNLKTGYKNANFIRQVVFPWYSDQAGGGNHATPSSSNGKPLYAIDTHDFTGEKIAYMTPYSRPDTKFYGTELQKVYMDGAFEFDLWVISVNNKLDQLNVGPEPSMPAVCKNCFDTCNESITCMKSSIYQQYCQDYWDNSDAWAAKKKAAEDAVTKALGQKPKEAPRGAYECDPLNPTECMSARCDTQDYSRINLFTRDQEVALPCSHSKVNETRFGGNVTEYDVITCKPSIMNQGAGGKPVFSTAKADYLQGNGDYATSDAGDIVLFSFPFSKYPPDHVVAHTETNLFGTSSASDAGCVDPARCVQGAYPAEYKTDGKPVVGYTVMNRDEFPKTMLAQICNLQEGQDYQVVEVNDDTACGISEYAPENACLIVKDPNLPVGKNTCNIMYGNCGTGFLATDVGPHEMNYYGGNPLIVYNGLVRTFGKSSIFIPIWHGDPHGPGSYINNYGYANTIFPEEIRPQFVKDLEIKYNNTGYDYECLKTPSPESGLPPITDCLAGISNAPKEIVLINGFGTCNFNYSSRELETEYPVTKEYGWCDSCSLATLAYQKVERRGVPYVPLNEVGFSSISGSASVYKIDRSSGTPATLISPEVFEESQLNDPYQTTPICSWNPGYHIGSSIPSGQMNCSSNRDFEPYHKNNPFYIQAPKEVPEATYLKNQMARLLQSGAIPILDLSDKSNWEPGDAGIDLGSALQQGVTAVQIAAGGKDPVAKLVYNIGAVIVVVQDSNSVLGQPSRDELKNRSALVHATCPRCLTAVHISSLSGTDNATFVNEVSDIFGGKDCFGLAGNPVGGQCDMQVADDPLLGVDLVIFDYGVQENQKAYADATNPKKKADAVLLDLENRGSYLLQNYKKPSIIYDFWVGQDIPGNDEYHAKLAWNDTEVRQLFNEIINKEDGLVAAGINGIFYSRIAEFGPLDWSKLQAQDGSIHEAMCSLSNASTRMVAQKPMSFFKRVYASGNVSCVDCTADDLYSGKCNMNCSDGTQCLPGADVKPPYLVRCPDDGVPEPCTPCNETGKTYTCRVEYDNGSVIVQDVDSKDMNTDSYADVISGLNPPDKCCISKGGTNYTYMQQSVTLSVDAPIAFSKTGDTNIDCSFPSASSQKPSDSQFCNVKSMATNYRVSCFDKTTYANLNSKGAFKNGFDFNINYNQLGGTGKTGDLPGQVSLGNIFKSGSGNPSAGGTPNGVITSPGAALAQDPCLSSMISSSGGHVRIGSGSGYSASSQPVGPGGVTPGGTGQTDSGTGTTECPPEVFACSAAASSFEKDAEIKCKAYIADCKVHPYNYTATGIYQYCYGEDSCQLAYDRYCANVTKKYGADAYCNNNCCKKSCETFCSGAGGTSCTTTCQDGPCPPEMKLCQCAVQTGGSCVKDCKDAIGSSSPIVNPPYPWAPGGALAGKSNDPCGVYQKTTETPK